MRELVLVGDHSRVPLTQISRNTVFSKSQNARKAGTLCSFYGQNICSVVPEIISSTIIFLSWNKKHIITTSSPNEGHLEKKQLDKEQKES